MNNTTLAPTSICSLKNDGYDVLQVKTLAQAIIAKASQLQASGTFYNKLNLVYEFTEGANVVYSIQPNKAPDQKSYIIF